MVLAISVGVVGWEVSNDGSDAQGFTTETAAVVIDVTARDRTGQPVLDLRADDFEIYEDGVRQEIAGVEAFLSATLAKARQASESPSAVDSRVPARTSRPL